MNEEKYNALKTKYCLNVSRVLLDNPSENFIPMVTGDSLTYTFNNGVVSFIDENGLSFVTPYYDIIPSLKQAGYKEGNLYVPFSDNNILNNKAYGPKWQQLLIGSRGEINKSDFDISLAEENSYTM